MAVDNLVEKHLEKEDQDIASKWRDDDKENNVQGKAFTYPFRKNFDPTEHCISRNFRVFYFREFRELNLKRENKNSRNIFPSFISERKVCTTSDMQV